jgi:hypothetical protein
MFLALKFERSCFDFFLQPIDYLSLVFEFLEESLKLLKLLVLPLEFQLQSFIFLRHLFDFGLVVLLLLLEMHDLLALLCLDNGVSLLQHGSTQLH